MDLLNSLGVTHDMRAVAHHDPDNRFVELREFGGAQDADDLIDIIEEHLSSWGDDSLASTLYNQLFELGINIEEHADAPGFVMAQWYPRISRLDISVVDYGIGIKASLANAGHPFVSDREAIIASTQRGITAKPKDGGAGLTVVREEVDRYSGVLTITSGGSAVVFSEGKNSSSACSWHGTAVDFSYSWVPKGR